MRESKDETYVGRAWLTVREAADYLQVCEKTIRRAYTLGRLRCSRIGNRIRIRPEWLDQWLEKQPI